MMNVLGMANERNIYMGLVTVSVNLQWFSHILSTGSIEFQPQILENSIHLFCSSVFKLIEGLVENLSRSFLQK